MFLVMFFLTAINFLLLVLMYYIFFRKAWLSIIVIIAEIWYCFTLESPNPHVDLTLDYLLIVGFSSFLFIAGISDKYEQSDSKRPTSTIDVVIDGIIERIKSSTAKSRLFNACASGNLKLVKYLIEEKKLDINNQYYLKKETILFPACRSGNLELVKYLVEHGVYINATNCFNENVLFSIYKNKKLDLFRYLISKGCSVTFQNNLKENILYLACKKGNLNLVKYLIDEVKMKFTNKLAFGETVLFPACRSGNLELVKYLIEEKKLNVNATNENGDTILLDACWSKKLELVKYLIEEQKLDNDDSPNDIVGTSNAIKNYLINNKNQSNVNVKKNVNVKEEVISDFKNFYYNCLEKISNEIDSKNYSHISSLDESDPRIPNLFWITDLKRNGKFIEANRAYINVIETSPQIDSLILYSWHKTLFAAGAIEEAYAMLVFSIKILKALEYEKLMAVLCQQIIHLFGLMKIFKEQDKKELLRCMNVYAGLNNLRYDYSNTDIYKFHKNIIDNLNFNSINFNKYLNTEKELSKKFLYHQEMLIKRFTIINTSLD